MGKQCPNLYTEFTLSYEFKVLILSKYRRRKPDMKRLQNMFMCVSLILVLINNGIAQDTSILAPSSEIIETVLDNRSIAMGNTAITTANSSAAIFSNPSILGTFSDAHVQVGGKLFYGTITDEVRNESDFYESYDASFPIFPNRSYFGFAFPYKYDNRLKLVFGIGYQRNEGNRFEDETTRLEDVWSDQRGDFVATRRTTTETVWWRGQLSTFTPGVALNLQDKFFFGVTLNRTLGAIIVTEEEKAFEQNTETETELEQTAMFLRIGALALITDELSIGLTYRPEFEWELGEAIVKTTVNGELYTERFQDVNELTIPGMWGIGASYKVSPKLVLAAELQSRPYSDLQWTQYSGLPEIIDDGFNISVGAEFLEFGFPVRVGAFRNVIPYVDENDTDPVDLIGLTAGIGSQDGQEFSWDVSVLWGMWEQTVNEDGQKYSEDLFRVGVSGTYHFETF